MIEIYQISIILALASIIIEMFTGTLILSAASFSFIIVAIFQYISNEFSLDRDLIIFTISMFTSIFFLRIIYRKKSDVKRLKDDDINMY
jgi:membrane protein implicated in regulation of membrane protease activity